MDTEHKTLGQIVADDYRAANIFETFGLDYCCNGNRTIKEACKKKNIKSDDVNRSLKENLKDSPNENINFQNWPLDLLVDYIEKKHHRYVEKITGNILKNLDKLCKVHGSTHQELFEINHLFIESSKDLAAHMKKEELILFPYIRKITKYQNIGKGLQPSLFGSITEPISSMMNEHNNEGNRFEKISLLTNQYQAPADSCSTFKVTYSLLQEFELDLHKHIHLENNILFPKSIKGEKKLLEGTN